MAARVVGAGPLLALLVAFAAVAAAFLAVPASAKVGGGDLVGGVDFGLAAKTKLQQAAPAGSGARCTGPVGQCDIEQEDLGLSGGGLSPAAAAAMRRTLAERKPTNRYISYAALRADQVPCNQRGRSYYSNCASQQAANPYRRGCSAITRCARNTN